MTEAMPGHPLSVRRSLLPLSSLLLQRGFFMPMSNKPRTYIRDDGTVMVEIGPNIWVTKDYAERMGLLR